MRIVVVALLFLAGPLSFGAYAEEPPEQPEVMPLNESLSKIIAAVNSDAARSLWASGDPAASAGSRASGDPATSGNGFVAQGLVPAEVEVVLHIVAVQSENAKSWNIGIPKYLGYSSEGSPDWTQGTHTVTVKFRNIAFAKSDELIFESGGVMPGGGWQLNVPEESPEQE